MKEEIISLRNQFLGQILDAKTPADVERIKNNYFGKKGILTVLFKKIKNLPEDERKTAGELINETKESLSKALLEQFQYADKKEKWFDPTLPGILPPVGHKHLVSQAIEEISDIFYKIGFVRRRYPEVEWDWYAFGSLNFPPNHPARDEWETFWVEAPAHQKLGSMVLTPHTSSGQVREMEKMKDSHSPIRMINIGKTYRRQSDVSHTPMFHQFEGLVIDRGISIPHLKGTLDHFAKAYFGEGRTTRLRPYDFVFTEPSFEVDISCGLCDGNGCKLCKQGWLEIGGAGMVHPNVLNNGGFDSKEFSGFAFGWGVERVLMMRSGLKIDDLRLIYSTDVRFLSQF
ncbi:phenylalanine--tRNA ligase subunit alpha [Candidatus Microgenomates bacterium]|nr:MAG: phenylalanine--tRNA ligase subunit alpha [Candidatus Microgenomates bacterium]